MPPVDWPSLLPAVTTAGGALAGVLLTLTIQSVLSARQRRHERQGRAFDVRLQVYADYLHHADAFSRVRRQLDDGIARLRKTVETRKAVNELSEELAAATERVNKGRSPEDVRELAAARRDADAQLESARRSIERDDEKLDKVRAAADKYIDKIFLLKSRIEVLGDPATLAAAAAIMSKVARKETPSNEERIEFRDAARRELRLDRRWWLARARSWLRRELRYLRKKIAKKRRAAPDSSA